MRQAEWSRAASRIPDFHKRMKDDVKISAAMESVLRRNPDAGTRVSVYLGEHPEESLAIAVRTLSNGREEWEAALLLAQSELTKIHAKLIAGPDAEQRAAMALDRVDAFCAGWERDHGPECHPVVLEGLNHMALAYPDLCAVVRDLRTWRSIHGM